MIDAFVFGAPIVIGLSVVRLLGVRLRHDPLISIAASWIAGSLVIAAIVLAFALVGRGFTLLGPAVGLVSAIALLAAIRGGAIGGESAPLPRATDFVFYSCVLASISYVAWKSVAHNDAPVLRGDENQIWAMRARVLFDSGGLLEPYRERMTWSLVSRGVIQHPDYPLMNPLLQVWVYSLHGESLYYSVRWLFQGVALALVLAVASAARAVGGSIVAGLLTLSVAVAIVESLQALHAAADGMLAASTVLACECLRRFRIDRDRKWWALTCVAMAGMTWSKHEGVILCGLVFAADWIGRRFRPRESEPVSANWRWLAIPLLPLIITLGVDAWMRVGNDMIPGATSRPAGRNLAGDALAMAAWIWRSLLADGSGQSFFYTAYFAALVLMPLKVIRATAGVALLPLLAWAVFFAIFATTPHDLGWHVETAARRVFAQTAGVMVIAIASAVGPLTGSWAANKAGIARS